MFGDLKNFKDVAHMISMREAVIMLNGVFEHIDDMLTLFESLEKIKVFCSLCEAHTLRQLQARFLLSVESIMRASVFCKK